MPADPLEIEIYPVKTERKSETFDLGRTIWSALKSNGISLLNHDIVVVSSKFASIAEGRMVELATVVPSKKATLLADKYSIDPSLAHLILEESEAILGGIPGFVLSIVQGTIAPNAGIDRSNVPEGWAVLYPKNPEATARKLRRILQEFCSPGAKELGVVVSDSRVTPTRLGTVGVALAASGIRSTVDLRGKNDLYGNKLKVTVRAIADQIATAAQLVMGETIESTPIALVRGVSSAFGKPRNNLERSLVISAEKCLILGGLQN